MTDPLSSDTALALQRIATLQVRDHSIDTVLQAVLDETTAVLPGHVDASISVLLGSRTATAAYSGQLALELDETQYERGHGPCLHAATTGETVEIVDARTETRWPEYTPRAVELRSLGSLSVPLPLPLEGLAAGLNVYVREPGSFDEPTRSAARRFAQAAAAAIGNVHAFQSARDVVANLETALQSRATIDQAKGILMERHKLTADQAFQFLTRASQAANVKLRDVAERLILTGEVLEPPENRRRPPRRRD